MSNDQTFNPEMFLNLTFNESNSTELLPVPDGEYIATSDPITEKSFMEYDIKNGDRAGQKGRSLIVVWNINDEGGALKTLLGRSPSVRQNIMLSISDNGDLSFGKGQNVELGKLREALGQNGTGTPWSFAMLGGKVAKVGVKSTLSTKDQKMYTNVTKVAKI